MSTPSPIEHLQHMIATGELVFLDGATGTEIERREVPMDAAAWSAAALLTHPQVIRAIHEDYIRAGSDVIITNSFSTARHQLDAAGLGDRFRELNASAVELAFQARDQAADRPVVIAGSISPVHFELEYMCPVDQAAENFREQADLLAAAGVDLLMIEMVWDPEYSAAAIRAAVATGLPTWIGFCCRLDGPETGQDAADVMLFSQKYQGTLESVLDPLLDLGGSVVNLMHTETTDVIPALEILQRHWSGPIGVYAHSGRFVMPHWQFNDVISPADYLAQARLWVEMGIGLVGGCCGIGPEHIRLLKQELPTRIPGGRFPSPAGPQKSSDTRNIARRGNT